ncbi:hypothetical protein BDFB_003179 [Asbolus verrucosus]|uniref:Uncharacterized protein n=1 Tax=Asbolus verrucosus TaxID=1661398 RepID=A0A482VLP1_ASBVE|nr:hypothetical protein BDFB_003179 [Asbolus verrucosus]
MWFIHEGAGPHTHISVRRYLNRKYPGRWIGRRARYENTPIWSARSPELNLLDFYFWEIYEKHNLCNTYYFL